MEVLLHHHVTAADEARVLLPHQHGGLRPGPCGVLGAVDEAEEVAFVEVLEAAHLVPHRDRSAQPSRDHGGESEAQVLARGAYVEEQIAGGGDRSVPWAAQFFEGVHGRAVLALPGIVDHDDPAVVRAPRRLLAQQLKPPVIDQLGLPWRFGQEELQPLHPRHPRTCHRLRPGQARDRLVPPPPAPAARSRIHETLAVGPG